MLVMTQSESLSSASRAERKAEKPVPKMTIQVCSNEKRIIKHKWITYKQFVLGYGYRKGVSSYFFSARARCSSVGVRMLVMTQSESLSSASRAERRAEKPVPNKEIYNLYYQR